MANVTYTVPNKNGSYDGDMVVKQYTSMIIDAGDTVTVDQPCRGLMILVQGDCTINGTLTMKAKGAYANPTSSGGSDSNSVDTNGLRLPFLTTGGSDTLTAANTLFNGCGTTARSVVANFKTIGGGTAGTILQISRTGNGDTDNSDDTGHTANSIAEHGSTGTNHTGGGGQGSGGYQNSSGQAGIGRSGTCFGGGSGGGGGNDDSSSAKDATAYGGPGGQGRSNHTARCTGGAGNPNGTEFTNHANTTSIVSSGQTGNGGVIWLIVGGDLTIGAAGKIECKGSQPDGINGGGYNWCSTGGGSGGGAVKIAYKGTFTNNGSIDVAGGSAGSNTNVGNGNQSGEGGNGGAGTSTTLQVL